MFPMKLHLPGLPKRTNNQRANWRAVHAERKKWKTLVALMVRAAGYHRERDKTLSKAKITITRYSSVRPDYDGLVSAGKALLDGLTLSGVILDDSYDVIENPIYNWCRGVKGAGYVEILIEEREEREDDEISGPARP